MQRFEGSKSKGDAAPAPRWLVDRGKGETVARSVSKERYASARDRLFFQPLMEAMGK